MSSFGPTLSWPVPLVGQSHHSEPQRMPTMKDNPKQIAEHLLETLGDDGAWQKVREGVTAAHEDEDNYTSASGAK